MSFGVDENGFRVVLVLIFVAVLMLFEGLYLLWQAHRGPQARVLSRRLQALSGAARVQPQVQVLKGSAGRTAPLLEQLAAATPGIRMLERMALQADLHWTPARLLLSCAMLGIGACVMFAVLAFQGPVTSLAAGALAACLPLAWIVVRRARRLARIQRQLPDALDFITRSLRSGLALTASLAMAGEELPEPIASEFRAANDEITFGVSLSQALTNLSERVPVTDVRYFVVSVLIQRESGGNLSEVLGNLSRLIRERYKLLSKIRVLSADGRLSAAILVMAPFALGGVMHYSNPEFMSLLWTDPLGIGMLKALAVLMLVGVLILGKIVKIRV